MSAFIQRLRNHYQTEEVEADNLPTQFPDVPRKADYIFYREDVGLFISIKSFSGRLRIRLFFEGEGLGSGVILNSMPRKDDTDVADVYRFITSEYLHIPEYNYRGRLFGYSPESGLCYGLQQNSIEKYKPENCGPSAFHNLSLSSLQISSFELEPALKAVLAPTGGRHSTDNYEYVFNNGVIRVDSDDELNPIEVIPFVYDSAWREYLEATKGELIKAKGEYSSELVSQNI